MSENYKVPVNLLRLALCESLISLYEIVDVKDEDVKTFQRLQCLMNWYLDCLERNLPFSFELVATKGWASRYAIELFRDEFSSQECRKALQIWAIGDKKMQVLLERLDLGIKS